MQMTAQDFLRPDGWFDRAYRAKAGERFPTWKCGLGLALQRGATVFVETGCVREADDWGAGMSTVLLAEVAKHHGGTVWTLDNTPEHLDRCRTITAPWKDFLRYQLGDSADLLRSFGREIDFLLLDSQDYPWPEMLQKTAERSFGGDRARAETHLRSLPCEDILREFGDLLRPPQAHCFDEYWAAQRWMHEGSVLMVDDGDFPGGGKPGLLRATLFDDGWTCVLDWQASVWVRR